MERLRTWVNTWPLEYEQTNPKKQGTSAFKRYEQYKAATTVKEAFDCGATLKATCLQFRFVTHHNYHHLVQGFPLH